MKFLRLAIPLLILADGAGLASAKDRHFADGLSVEAEVKEEDGKLRLTVVQYDENQESHWLLTGDLTGEGGGKYRLVHESTDENDKTHTLTGTVKISDDALTYSDLKDSGGKLEIPASGGPWKEIDDATLLRNARARYDTADKLLNTAWTQAKSEVGEKNFSPLRDGQRSWLKYRDAMSEKVVRDILGNPEKTPDYKNLPDYWQAMTEYTVTRTPVLRAWSGKSVPPGRSGIYRDSYGGEVTLAEKKDGLHFEINVVRTPAFNLGEISGTATLSGGSASWTDAPKPEGEKPATLTFTFNANRSLTIKSENADSYHGHNAHFDGQYFKIAPLKPETIKKDGA
ncbi:MAG TPA: lysozyme inhibitor LprI family protein [Verrucomicrobiales bacterium]|nr:lysozyme inhibitor LprI family protein [Verrucomicrobiales bacterium]